MYVNNLKKCAVKYLNSNIYYKYTIKIVLKDKCWKLDI